jgi:hypothetical protein
VQSMKFVGVGVHAETIAVAVAQQNREAVRATQKRQETADDLLWLEKTAAHHVR